MAEKIKIDPNITVTELLKTYPEVIPVFIHRQMMCVGCDMSAFERVQDAARIYGINPDTFLGELLEAIPPFLRIVPDK